MDITVQQEGNISLVSIKGDTIDASNKPKLQKKLEGVIEGSRFMVLDMSEVTFLDSSGLGMLLSCLRRLNGKKGDLRLCCLTKPVRSLIELVRLNNVIEIYDTSEAAMASVPRLSD